SQGRPTCLSSQAPPSPNSNNASAMNAKPRATCEIDGDWEGNLMGTPCVPVGARVSFGARWGSTAKARKAAPCYLHDHSCQASPAAPVHALTRAVGGRNTHSLVARSGKNSVGKNAAMTQLIS